MNRMALAALRLEGQCSAVDQVQSAVNRACECQVHCMALAALRLEGQCSAVDQVQPAVNRACECQVHCM